MAIKSVTTENIAEYVAGRPQASEITSAATLDKAAADAPTLGKPVIKEVEEKLPGTPDPGEQPDPNRPKDKKSVQSRIDELVKERHELDEAFQSEYEQRLRLEGEISAIRSQLQPKEDKEPPKPELGPEPDPAAYTDQKKFLAEWGEWQRKKARAEFQAEEAQRRAQEEAQKRELAMQVKVEKAKEEFPDYLQVLKAAEKRTPIVPLHIKAAFEDSDWGAHLAYYLMKDAMEEKRIFALPPAKALLELGKIEEAFEKKAKPTPPPVNPGTPETNSTPAPIAKLGEAPGMIPADLSQPMSFKDYRKNRLEQIRAAGRKRH